LREVFGERNVHLIAISPDFEKIGLATLVVMGVNGDLKIGDFESFLVSSFGNRAEAAAVPAELLEKFMNRSHSVVLRDDYAPVDNLIAPVFGYNRKIR
jgi:hypothetical protein